MRFIKQEQTLPIQNIDLLDTEKKKHGLLLPNTVRCLIVGPSNCGKTNVLISLLEHENGLRFENLYIYSKSIHQPKYEYLQQIMKPISEIGYFTFTNNAEVIPPKKVMPNSVFVFDDVACENQDSMREYFCMGRHFGADCFYLCQTYTRIPKHLIRDNANFLVIFKQDDLNLKHIYSDHVNTDMSFDMFRKVCIECWKDNYGFLVIDKDSPLNLGRYRRGFDVYITSI